MYLIEVLLLNKVDLKKTQILNTSMRRAPIGHAQDLCYDGAFIEDNRFSNLS